MKGEGEQKVDTYLGRVAGAVILYNSSEDVIENILTYIDQVELLYVIDNSDQENTTLIKKLKAISSIQYISIGSNKGVAYALNVAADQAIHDGFNYLLTMDDDSKASIGMVKVMGDFLKSYSSADKVGIVAVAHSRPIKSKAYKKVTFTMTSGNLLNLSAYQKTGPFNNDLFIDHVDHEYGIRLTIGNYEIIELTALKLIHNLGTNKEIIVKGKSFSFVSHSPERFYYFIRNGLYITIKYFFQEPYTCLQLLKLNLKESIKLILFENNKKKRFFLLLRAVKDGCSSRLGKIVYI